MSSLYRGIHYRFDSEVGLRMGRAVGALAVREATRVESRESTALPSASLASPFFPLPPSRSRSMTNPKLDAFRTMVRNSPDNALARFRSNRFAGALVAAGCFVVGNA